MTDTRTVTTRTGRPKGNRWTHLAYTVAAIAILLLAGGKFMSPWFMPTCDKPSIEATVRGLFESKNLVLTVFNDIRELTSSHDRRTCSAHIETVDQVGTVQYSIVWQWWWPYVTVEKVDSGVRGSSGDNGGGVSGGGKITGGSEEVPTGIDMPGSGGETPTVVQPSTGGDIPAGSQ
jgi:uncharacterized membrane protein YgcG